MERKTKIYEEWLFDELESLCGDEELCMAPCSNCKHFNCDNPDVCTAFPGGIPVVILNGQHKHRTPFPGDNGIQWTDQLTKKERKEAVLLLTNNKEGAMYRIALAAKEGEPPDPRDIEMLENKQGRPKKGILQAGFEETDVIEDYHELRTHGINYDHACEIVAYLQNFYAEEQGRKTIGTKHIKAIITSWNNQAKNNCTEEEWSAFKAKQEAYLKECKQFWGRKIYYDK